MQRNESLDNFWNRSDSSKNQRNQSSSNYYNTSRRTNYRNNAQSLYDVDPLYEDEQIYDDYSYNIDYNDNNMNQSTNKNNRKKNSRYQNTNVKSLYNDAMPYNQALSNTSTMNNSNYNRAKGNIIPMPVDRVDNSATYQDSDNSGNNISEWLVMFLLITIPVVNIIVLIKWAFDNKNPQKQAFAKAFMFWALVLITFTLVMLNLFYDKFDPLSKIKTIKFVMNNMISNMTK